MSKRIYVVENAESEEQFLVKAPTQAAAIRAVVSARYKADVATQDQLIALIQKGMKVQEA